MDLNELRKLVGLSRIDQLRKYLEALGMQEQEYFSTEDVEKIKAVRRLVQEEKLTITEAAKRYLSENSALSKNIESDTTFSPATPTPTPATTPTQEKEPKEVDPKKQMKALIREMAEQSAKKLAAKYPEMFIDEFQKYTQSEEYAELWQITANEMLQSQAQELDEYVQIIDAEIKAESYLTETQISGQLPAASLFNNNNHEEDDEDE